MALNPAFIHIAERLQEAANKMCHADIRTRISDALRDATKGTGDYCYVANVFGDDKSGDVVYSCGWDGGLKKAGYMVSGANCTIDVAGAVDVQPLTTYEVETADVEASEAGARNSRRDLKQLQSIHDAATSLGATCAMSESATPVTGVLKLNESAAFALDIPITEAFKAGHAIKIIAPGKGSSAFYPAEVLKRDGPKVFKAGTPMNIDHPTAAEESARPEGSVKNWGAVLSRDAYWLDDHAQGPGLYSEVKPFSDHAQTIAEKGPYAGVSIRANGSAVMEAGRPVLKEGVPILASLISAESVDMVTRAGAGGMFLSEAARTAPNNSHEGQVEMDEAAVNKLIESAVAKANAPLIGRALRGDATVLANRLLADISLPEAAKQEVIANVLREALPVIEGTNDLDTAKFGALVTAESKRIGALVSSLTGGGRVTGMGAPGEPIRTTEAVIVKPEEVLAKSVKTFMRLGMSEAAATAAAKGRVQ